VDQRRLSSIVKAWDWFKEGERTKREGKCGEWGGRARSFAGMLARTQDDNTGLLVTQAQGLENPVDPVDQKHFQCRRSDEGREEQFHHFAFGKAKHLKAITFISETKPDIVSKSGLMNKHIVKHIVSRETYRETYRGIP
jgi:hypothetical protein